MYTWHVMYYTMWRTETILFFKNSKYINEYSIRCTGKVHVEIKRLDIKRLECILDGSHCSRRLSLSHLGRYCCLFLQTWIAWADCLPLPLLADTFTLLIFLWSLDNVAGEIIIDRLHKGDILKTKTVISWVGWVDIWLPAKDQVSDDNMCRPGTRNSPCCQPSVYMWRHTGCFHCV